MTGTANSEAMPESGQNYQQQQQQQQQQQSYQQQAHSAATASLRDRKVSIQDDGGRARERPRKVMRGLTVDSSHLDDIEGLDFKIPEVDLDVPDIDYKVEEEEIEIS